MDNDRHLFLPSPAGDSFKYFVAAVSNIRWPLASALPQVAVLGFFPSLESAQEYQAAHQKYKPGTNSSIPDGPIFMIMETARLFPLGISPRRLLGDQSVHLAKKRDAVLRNYYRKRQLDKQDVNSRKGKEDAQTPKPISGAELEKDKRLKRTVHRRARKQAWELLQRLYAQKDRVERAKQALLRSSGETAAGAGAGAGSGDFGDEADPEMRDFLASLTDAEREAFIKGPDVEVGEESDKVPELQAKKLTEVAKNTKLGSIDEYIEWAIQHFKNQNVEPANDDMMDEEERRQELAELSRIHGSTAGGDGGDRTKSSTSYLPAVEGYSAAGHSTEGYCVGTIFYDTSGEALNADCPEAIGKEHIVTFFEPFATAEAARNALETTYKNLFAEEKLFFVRMGQWCCFDHVTEDDGQQIYREEMIGEMFKSNAENSMLKFIEESFKHRPDVLPIPTTK